LPFFFFYSLSLSFTLSKRVRQKVQIVAQIRITLEKKVIVFLALFDDSQQKVVKKEGLTN